ncbi:heterogeneous nuclear ribonucleoprotein 1 [Prunus yedoensis var. nudiflora]|uniref:Heterogeneous nuclear ribonucleoprotein 1 n=1 Tax=Prunus yedoensis var. nudiflora TaxID=2094558 RepID=A0A314ZT75_PRUYE|nr:heterogeneous nuclear ribonucleoprotein 1 [Prunus yedoensis var. nudiflora]
MDSDEGKLFIGGLAWDTTEDKLTDYFNQYGDVTQTVIMRDKTTGRPRGFGFVVFSDPSVLDRVLNDKHTIDGRVVEAKKALSREEQQTSNRSGNFNTTRSSGGGGNFKTKKIFVGGLPSTLTEDGFRQFFENYGSVTDVVIMYDQNTQRPRGFGFITFDTEDAVDRVLHKNYHELNGKLVEVKRALPKDANPGGGGRGGGFQGYNASGPVQMHLMAAWMAIGYGYGAANTGVGYGGYGSYGLGGYGSANTGFGGPAGSYGNPNAPNAGYVSGAPAALKSTWSNQTPSGYGASGYGAAAPWSAPGGSGAPSAPRGQSPSGASGYGNQGYGYGNYGGSYASYPGGYGSSGGRGGSTPTSNSGGSASGGEQQGTRGGYMGSGYGDTNGNSGYSNASWRSDPSQATGGYGGSQSRQA